MPGPGGEAWTEDDVEYALAWQQLRAETCTGCGQPKTESFDLDNAGLYETRMLRCHACAARDDAEREFTEAGGNSGGLHLAVIKKPN